MGGKGKFSFIKNHMTRDGDFISSKIKTPIRLYPRWLRGYPKKTHCVKQGASLFLAVVVRLEKQGQPNMRR